MIEKLNSDELLAMSTAHLYLIFLSNWVWSIICSSQVLVVLVIYITIYNLRATMAGCRCGISLGLKSWALIWRGPKVPLSRKTLTSKSRTQLYQENLGLKYFWLLPNNISKCKFCFLWWWSCILFRNQKQTIIIYTYIKMKISVYN